jgi:hypothetical protein
MRRALAILGLAWTACTGGARDSVSVPVGLALTAEECARLTDEAQGGGPMEGTFAAVAGAEFPPITEFRSGVHPCAPPDGDSESVQTFTVHVPEGGKRVFGLAVLGRALRLGDLAVPQAEIEGLPLQLRTPRAVFFAGGVEIDREDQERGEVELELHPFVNLVGSLRRGGEPASGRITFFLPAADRFLGGRCLRFFDLPEAPAVEAVYHLRVGERGAFFASMPYRATDLGCPADPPQGNEGFAFAETERGEVALIVPGRAEDRGAGLEPGMLLTHVLVLLRSPEAVDRIAPVVTSVARLPSGSFFKVYVSGYGLSALAGAARVPFAFRRLVGGQEQPSIDAFLQIDGVDVLAAPGASTTEFPSYARFRRFGARQPSVLFARAVDALGSEVSLPEGDYRVTLPGFEMAALEFRIAAAPGS